MKCSTNAAEDETRLKYAETSKIDASPPKLDDEELRKRTILDTRLRGKWMLRHSYLYKGLYERAGCQHI